MKISHFSFFLARWAETFGAISHVEQGVTDEELRLHRDEALKKTYLCNLPRFKKKFSWFLHLSFMELSLKKQLKQQGRLSQLSIFLNCFLKSLKRLYLFIVVLWKFFSFKKDYFAFSYTGTTSTQPDFFDIPSRPL